MKPNERCAASIGDRPRCRPRCAGLIVWMAAAMMGLGGCSQRDAPQGPVPPQAPGGASSQPTDNSAGDRATRTADGTAPSTSTVPQPGSNTQQPAAGSSGPQGTTTAAVAPATGTGDEEPLQAPPPTLVPPEAGFGGNPPTVDPTSQPPATAAPAPREPPPEAKGLLRPVPHFDVWWDKAGGRVVLAGTIVRREGYLEVFACLKGTKEHETIVAVQTEAKVVHAGLLFIGAEQGRPVRFEPEYRPATGQVIEVTVHWTDAQGKRRAARAQDFIRHVRSRKPLEHPWVFAGSGFWESPDTGERYYLAEGGELICVSNFPSALLDLPIESTDTNEELLYEAFTENIPPVGTEVALVLRPVDPPPLEAPSPRAE
jgi:hypothetical protein